LLDCSQRYPARRNRRKARSRQGRRRIWIANPYLLLDDLSPGP
jgi:hypothetical protein